MANHSSILAWRIPWREEPGGLQSRGSQRNMTEATQCTRTPEHTLEGLMLKLKLQYFAHMTGRVDSLEKTLMLGKIEGERRRG